MKIMITGATGLIGRALVVHFSNHELTLVGRTREKIQSQFSNHHSIVTWDELKTSGETHIQHQDVIINLAGENIGAKRWTTLQKQKILNSRVDATRTISDICARLDKSPRILNASAVGVYGFSNDKIFTENNALKNPECFLETVAKSWEQALLSAENAHVPVVKMRFGVVLSNQGGALKQMLPAFKFGFGAILGNGQQPFSWIALSDLIRAIDFLILHPEITGPVNMASPGIISQANFAKALARTLNRPRFMRFPAWFIHFLFGQMGDELLLHGQSVKSEKLLRAEFSFQFDTIHNALQDILNR